MSVEPPEYQLNFDAANELERQSERTKRILERLAAHLAANRQRDSIPGLVEREDVIRAADLVLERPAVENPPTAAHDVFLSHSHEDDEFVRELTGKLSAAQITYFKADRDICPAADWGGALWEAIRNCRVFVSVVTPRFIESRWCDLECGAACASRKPVLPLLRYVERNALRPPFDRFQALVVETSEQLDYLVATLTRLCGEDER